MERLLRFSMRICLFLPPTERSPGPRIAGPPGLVRDMRRAREIPSRDAVRPRMVSIMKRIPGPVFFLVVCALIALPGCGKKDVRQDRMVFNLDEVFMRKERPREEESWKVKGLRLAKERDFIGAIEAFKRHVEEEPEEFFGFNALAVSYKNLADHSLAMTNYERALEFTDSAEERAKVLANIGNLYYSANKPQAALGYYKEASSEFDRNPFYRILIARTFISLKEHDRARKVLATVEEKPQALEKYESTEDQGGGYFLLAQCYLALGEEERLLKYAERALKANPDRFVPRLRRELNDERSLLYTMKEDRGVKDILTRYADKLSLGSWLEHSEGLEATSGKKQ